MEAAALDYYELAPGESFAFGYHRHENQKEVFYVLSGTATFETETGDVSVSPGEAIRFAPGEFQQGFNRGNERVVALALGAPADAGTSEVRRDCPGCGERTEVRIERGEDGTLHTRCVECETVTDRFD